MARSYRRDSRGRFSGGGGGGKATGGSLKARTSARRSRAKLAAKDQGDKSLSGSLSRRAQRAAVTRTGKAAATAKASNRTKMSAGKASGTIGKRKGSQVSQTRPAKRQATGADLVRRFDRLNDGGPIVRGNSTNPSPVTRRQRQLRNATDPAQRRKLEKRVDRAMTTQSRAIAFRNAMAGVKAIGYSGKVSTPEGRSQLEANYRQRPRYSTRQRIRPSWMR